MDWIGVDVESVDEGRERRYPVMMIKTMQVVLHRERTATRIVYAQLQI